MRLGVVNEREPDYLDELRWKPKREPVSPDPASYPAPPDAAPRDGDAPLTPSAILPVEPIYTYRADETQPTARGGCRGCVWLVAGMGGCMMIVVIALVGAVALGFVSIGGLFGGFANAFNVPVRADVVSTRTLVTRLQPLGVLVTFQSEMALENVRVGVQQNVGNACGIAASHRVTGGIEAGIDLSTLSEDDIRYDAVRDTYVVTLPTPTLTTCRVDTIEQYDNTFTMCPVDWDNVRALAQYTALTQMRDDALEGGMLERAGSEARLVLGNMFSELGVNIEIVYADAANPAQMTGSAAESSANAVSDETPTSEGVIGLGASCQPSAPQGWRFDAGTGGWTR
jgi:hypothetical protein